MTLLQLQKRINDTVAANEKSGWSNRNSMDACIRLNRQTPTGRIKSRVRDVAFVCSNQLTVGQGELRRDFGITLEVDD